MKRLASFLSLLALAACATVEDSDCRRVTDIIGDADYYRICLIQKRGAQ